MKQILTNGTVLVKDGDTTTHYHLIVEDDGTVRALTEEDIRTRLETEKQT